MRFIPLIVILVAGVASAVPDAMLSPAGLLPGGRVLLDAHNAYPYEGRYADRIDRALASGLPVAIEQDLAWCPARSDGTLAPVVSHEHECVGGEPTLETYFFLRIRPLMEEALARGRPDEWPLVTLNLDFKSNDPALHQAVWALLAKYERWLTTAPAGVPPGTVAPLTPGPLLVLTGDNDAQEAAFAGPSVSRLRLFGAIHSLPRVNPDDEAELPRARPATNYRRWWNHPWRVVEIGGPQKAGAWTPEDEQRLRAIAADAHRNGLWIRFYTLNGHAPSENQGWFDGYNFGTLDAAALRWRAAISAGVDFIATDQYEAYAIARKIAR